MRLTEEILNKLTPKEIKEIEMLLHQNDVQESRSDLFRFTKTTFKQFQAKEFHQKYYELLNAFAEKRIMNLITTMPPQHGKSEGSSRRLPAYLAGFRPDEHLALVSYSATKAQKFGREIINIINEPIYKKIFPKTLFPSRGYTGNKANTNQERESISHRGSMKFVGTEGPLTGDPVDVLIMDDLYKDWQTANSPIYQQRVWDWYASVAETRLHNGSQQLIVFTRWSENDLVGKLENLGFVVEWNGDEDLDEFIAKLKPGQFVKINFKAIKEDPPSKFDPRPIGSPLWPEKHSLTRLKTARSKNPVKFDCLYQGEPENKEGMLYGEFKTYKQLPEAKIIKNYTDTADSGNDYLCSVNYLIPLGDSPLIYITDVYYTQDGMEKTEAETIEFLMKGLVNKARIESNNGGRGFARVVQKGIQDQKGRTEVNWFHQSNNKEARIYSNSASVNNRIVMPEDWHVRFPAFYKHVTKYQKLFKLNKFDDAPDVLTGIIETENVSTIITKPTRPKRNIRIGR